MEPREKISTIKGSGRDTLPAPAGRSRIKRIGDQTRGLVDDVKSWVELRIKLTQLEIEENVESRINYAASGAAVVGVAATGVLFALVAAAIALGRVLGHDAWGFLVIAGLLLLVALIMWVLRPRVAKFDITGGKSDAVGGKR